MNDIKQALEQIISAYAQGFNRQDTEAIAALYAKDGMHINAAGPRTDIEQFYQTLFKAGFDHLDGSIDEAWLIGDDAALAIGQYNTSGKDKNGAPMARGGLWTATYVREGGRWKIRMQTALPK